MRPGVAAADKLTVWRLTQYTRVLFLDVDVLVLRPLDALFDEPSQRGPGVAAADKLTRQCDG